MQYAKTYAQYTDLVAQELEKILSDCPPSKLRDAMEYSVQAGGKRIRPVLALAVCEMLGGQANDALAFACGIELIHTYSLIHDDLPCMDNDDLRRGKPTNHKVFGEAMAVLAGDGLLSLAFEHMLANIGKDANRFAALRAVAQGCGVRGMVLGQVEDMEGESRTLSLAELQSMHSKKTGALIAAACLAGGYAANADAEDIALVQRYGELVGLAFQITDDLLDCTADTSSLGKTAGKDAEAGKSTYVTLLGLQEAEAKAAEAVEAALECLTKYGEKAAFLRMFAENILSRQK